MACLALVFIAMLSIGGFPVRANGAAAPRKIVIAYAAMNARVAPFGLPASAGSSPNTA